MGTATVDLTGQPSLSYEFTQNADEMAAQEVQGQNVVVVNVKLVLLCILILAGIFIIILLSTL